MLNLFGLPGFNSLKKKSKSLETASTSGNTFAKT